MKRFLLLSLFFAFYGTTVLCQTGLPEKGCFPLTVNFEAPAGSPSFFWDFKDGVTSMNSNPSHLFTSAGVFEVEFRHSQGGPVIGTVTITIYAKPDLMISVEPTLACPGKTIQLSDETIYPTELIPTSLQWTLGDGNSATGKDVNHTYSAPGFYTLSLFAGSTLPGCSSTKIFTDLIEIYAAPIASFTTTPDPPVVCAPPLTVMFTNTSMSTFPTTYSWTFGNGDTFDGSNPPDQTYTTIGNFIVQLTATDSLGCISTFSRGIGTGPGNLNINIPDTGCVELPITIQNLSPSGVHAWDFGVDADPPTSTIRNPSVIYNNPGTYTILYTWTSPNGQCASDTSFTVVVQDNKISYEAIYPDPYCGPPIDVKFIPDQMNGSFIWNFSRFGESTEIMPEVMITKDPFPYSVFGKRYYNVSLNWSTEAGCGGSIQKEEFYIEPTAAFRALEYEGCIDFEAAFLDMSESHNIISWTWDFGDGTILTYTDHMDTIYHVYDTCDLFQVTLTIEDSLGCTATSYPREMKVCGCPEDGGGGGGSCGLNIMTSTICHGDTLFYSVTASPSVVRYRVESDGDRLWHCSNTPGGEPLFWVFDHEPGFHDIKLSWETRIGNRDSIIYEDILFVEGAWARMNYQTDCVNPNTVTFTDSSINATNVLWTFPDGTTYTDRTFTHTFPASGDYLVHLSAWDENSTCDPDADSMWVYVRNLKADFTMPTEVCQGALLPLDATSSVDVNIVCHKGFTWFFSQGPRPMTLENPDTLGALGIPCENEVSLVVADINGCRDTLTKTVNVQAVEVEIELDAERICFPATLNPVAVSAVVCGDLENLTWMVGNLTFTGANPTINIPDGFPVSMDGTITITVQAESSLGCKGSASKVIQVYKPVSVISILPESGVICEGDAFEFTATDFTQEGSSLDFSWNFGNNQTGTGQNVSYTYPTAGTYNVQLNIVEKATGCPGKTERTVVVQAYPEAGFTTNLDQFPVLCYPQQIFFADASISNELLTYQWNFGNGAPISTSPNPSTVYGKGTFTTTLTVTTSAGCSDTVERTFTLIGPEGKFTFDKSEVCIGEPITLTLSDTSDVGSWTWFFEGTSYTDVNPVTHIYTTRPPAGFTFAKVVMTDDTGVCPFSDSLLVPLILTLADFELPSGPICPGSTLEITNTSEDANTYAWTFSNGSTSTQTNPVITVPSQPGIFTIELLATNNPAGCKDSLEQTIMLSQLQLEQLVGDTICPGDTATISLLDMLPGFVFSWTPSATLLSPTSPITEAIPTTTTTYTVTASNGNGCLATGTATVLVLEPFSLMDWDTTVVVDATVVLPGPIDPRYTYQWIGQGLSCTNCAQPTYIASDSNEFVLIVRDVLGCFEAQATYRIKVVPNRIELPNVFTPNKDGTNDFFQIIVPGGSLEDIAVQKLRIYNRWGNLIYDNEIPGQGWDGTYKGEDQPSDVYAYVVEVTFYDGRTETLRGDITLVR